MYKPGQYVRYKPEQSTDEAQRLVYVVHSVDHEHGTVCMVCINPMSSDNPTVTVSQEHIEKIWEGTNMKKLIINSTAIGSCDKWHQNNGAWCFELANRIKVIIPMDEIKLFSSCPDLEIVTYHDNFTEQNI